MSAQRTNEVFKNRLNICHFFMTVVISGALLLYIGCGSTPAIQSDVLEASNSLDTAKGIVVRGRHISLIDVREPEHIKVLTGTDWGSVSAVPVATSDEATSAIFAVGDELYTLNSTSHDINLIFDASSHLTQSQPTPEEGVIALLLQTRGSRVAFEYFGRDGTSLVIWDRNANEITRELLNFPPGVDVHLGTGILTEVDTENGILQIRFLNSDVQKAVSIEQPTTFSRIDPSGARVLVSSSPLDEQSPISIVDVHSEAARVISNGNSASWLDDERILFLRDENQLWIHYVKTGREELLARVGEAPVRNSSSRARRPIRSWDGRYIAWQWTAMIAGREQRGLLAVDLESNLYVSMQPDSLAASYGWVSLEK